MFCKECGNRFEEGQGFCTKCGRPIGDKGVNTGPLDKVQTKPKEITPSLLPVPEPNNPAKSKKATRIFWPVFIGIFSGLAILIGGFSMYTLIIRNSKPVQSVEQPEVADLKADTPEPELIDPPPSVEQPKIAKQSKNEFMASCEQYTYEQLARDPARYIGKPMALYGQIVQVTEDGSNIGLRVNITEDYYNWKDTIYVDYIRESANESRILEDDFIMLWGTSRGTVTYETVLGSSLTVPHVLAAYIEVDYPNSPYTEPEVNDVYDYESEYILPYSDMYYLNYSDIEYLSDQELRFARNEIYARYGRMFNSEELQNYFNKQSWYRPTILANQFNESTLNEIEKHNVEFIQSYEK